VERQASGLLRQRLLMQPVSNAPLLRVVRSAAETALAPTVALVT
jgi:hypothetical protein